MEPKRIAPTETNTIMPTTRHLGLLGLCLLLSLLFAIPADAQDRRRRSGPLNPERLTRELDLTEQQRVELETLLTAFRMDMRDVRRGGAAREEMKELHELLLADIRGLLNDEQKARFEEVLEKNRRTDRREGRDRGRRSGRGIGGLLDRIGLTDQQKEELRERFKSLGGERKALRKKVQSGELTREEARKKGRALAERRRTILRDVLTDEQWKKVEAFRKNRGRRGERDRRNRRDRLRERLDLTPEQTEAMEELHRRFRKEFRELREAARNGELDREQIRPRMRELRTQLRKEMADLLTEEQKQRLEELRKNRPGRDRPGRRRGRRDRDEKKKDPEKKLREF